MSKIRYILYFSQNELYLLDKKRNRVVSDFFLSIENDEITDELLFNKEFRTFLSKNKIHLSIFGNKLEIILNQEFSLFYKNNIKNIFLEYFKNVKFINLINILKIDAKKAYMHMTTNYIDYYYYKGNIRHIRVPLNLFNNNIYRAYNYCLTSLFKPKKIYIFGSNPDIPNICDKLSKEQPILVIFIEDYKTYVLELYSR